MATTATSAQTAEHTAAERVTHARTVCGMALTTASLHSDSAALRFARDGEWTEMSYSELGKAVSEIARGLMALGIEPGDRVSILSSTRAEWTLADLGALCAGAVVAPIYHTNSPEECLYILEHAGSRVVFCENAEQVAKVRQVAGGCPDLEQIVVLDGTAEGALTLGELRERGANIKQEAMEATARAVAPGDPATIVYTSGTTGPPKGCVTTHDNVMATARMYEDELEFVSGDDPVVVFMFLPLAHSLARVTQMVTLDVGGTIAFWRRDPKVVLEDLASTRPTHVPSVPRVFEKVYTKAMAGVEEAGRVKRAIFHWALETGRRARELEHQGRSPGALLRRRHALADKLVLSKVRGLFGPDIRLALTGAAPIAPDVLEFFDACGVLIVEGYGLTETTAAGTLNTQRRFRFGTVGRPLAGTEASIAADGEIMLRGPNLFAGYFRDEDATRKTMTSDGWLKSGDLGSIDEDGFVRITGRKKDLIVTSSGKNISAANIESTLRESRWISEAVVFGDRRPFLVALLTLDADEAPALAERVGVDFDLSAMAHDKRVLAELAREVEQLNSRFARIEQVKRFAVAERDLSQADGDMTPTLKVKRAVVYNEYADLFESLYD